MAPLTARHNGGSFAFRREVATQSSVIMCSLDGMATKPRPNDVVLTTRITKAVRDGLRKIADREDRSVASVIRRALAEFVDRES